MSANDVETILMAVGFGTATLGVAIGLVDDWIHQRRNRPTAQIIQIEEARRARTRKGAHHARIDRQD